MEIVIATVFYNRQTSLQRMFQEGILPLGMDGISASRRVVSKLEAGASWQQSYQAHGGAAGCAAICSDDGLETRASFPEKGRRWRRQQKQDCLNIKLAAPGAKRGEAEGPARARRGSAGVDRVAWGFARRLRPQLSSVDFDILQSVMTIIPASIRTLTLRSRRWVLHGLFHACPRADGLYGVLPLPVANAGLLLISYQPPARATLRVFFAVIGNCQFLPCRPIGTPVRLGSLDLPIPAAFCSSCLTLSFDGPLTRPKAHDIALSPLTCSSGESGRREVTLVDVRSMSGYRSR